MSRSLSATLLLVLCLAVTGATQTAPKKKSALDKATLEAYIRHLYVLNSSIDVQIADPKPSELPGFLEVKVHASMAKQFQDFTFYVSEDGSKIVQGTVFDVNNNPFKADLDKLKTEFQPSLGTPGAPVVLVEFSDFQCPYCQQEATMLRQNLLAAYPKQVRLYFKEFPLESLHPWARPAAIAGTCVFRQAPATFWDYHDWIFGHQGEITPENLKSKVMEWAKGEKDIDALALARCLDTKETLGEVDKNIADGQAVAVSGTPTLFINGRRIAQTIDWPSLRSIIDYEVEYQKTAKNAGEDCGCDLKLDLPGLPSKKP